MALSRLKPCLAQLLCRCLSALPAFALQFSLSAAENPAALPPVGKTELHILSPTVLELSLVTTKEPDPAPVTTWNFIGENFAPNLPLPGEFVVKANGAQIAVAEVGFKRRPLYAPLKQRDLRIGNYIYLRLATAISDAQVVTVTNPTGLLWDDSRVQYQTAASSMRFNPALHVNQQGYTTRYIKKAMVGFYLGSLGELDIPSTSFNILDAASDAVRFSGTLKLRQDVGYTYSPTPYQKVYEADFTALASAGEYVLQVPGMGISYPFLIHDGTAAAFARNLALGLYHQRCGGKNELPFTRHEHGVCHSAPAAVPDMTFTSVNNVLANVSSDYSNNPLHTAPQLKDVNSSLYPFINKGPVDVSGGHHDAGDYSKYTINSAALIHHLVFAADNFPGVAALDNLGLPESGDGRSDLLQEAKWESDFLCKMQDADGGFYFLVYPRDREYENDVLPDHGDPQVVFPKTTAVTAAAVGALAEIGSSPTFRAQFPAEAAACLDKARRGWSFLTNAIARFGKNGSYQKITHYGNEFMHDDELAWAAAALFAATGDPAFHDQLKAWYDPSDPNTRRWSWWRLFEGYGCAARTYAFAARSGRLPASALDPAYLAKCEAEIVAAGDDIARFAEESAYGTSFPDPNKSYRTAGWYFSSERSFELATAQQIKPSPRYLEALLSNMNYEGGCNPVNMPFITGLGWQRWRDIVHQYAQNDYQVLPPAGLPLGNIQGGFAWLENYKRELGQLCFPPDGAAAAPYPFYDRWADSFNTTTEFVVVDQARSLASLAFLMADSRYISPSVSATGRITGTPASIAAGETVTVAFSADGVNLAGARITWEARDQQPFIGNSFTFTPRNPGEQWLEAEALLPDGTRVFCKTNFTASYSTSAAPNVDQSAPVPFSPEVSALYHLDGSLSDSAGRNPPLSLSGSASFDANNLGWMSSRSGQALRFHDLGDKATVTLPLNLAVNGSTEITLEAMVFVNAYKAWNRSQARLLSLQKSWNASLNWIEDMYTGVHVTGGTTFDFTGPLLNDALPVQQWHHLVISISASGYALRVDGKVVAAVPSGEFANWNGSGAVLEFGNFDGWIDEVVVRSVSSSPVPIVEIPAAPSNLQAKGISTSQIALSWSDNASNESAYRISRSLDGVNWSAAAVLSSNITSWTDSTLNAGKVYFYRLAAANSAGESQPVTVSSSTLAPVPPAAPVISAVLTNAGAVTVCWKRSVSADTYTIYRSTLPDGPFIPLRKSIVGLYFSDRSVVPGATCWYAVSAQNAAGNSSLSAPVAGRVNAPGANVQFLRKQENAGGDWKGRFGADGYNVAGNTWKLPPYASLTLAGSSDWTWEQNSADARVLQTASGDSRIAACWYASNSFDIDIQFSDGIFHKVAFQILDWDRLGRAETVELLDATTGRVLHTLTLTSLGEGVWLEYLVQGHVVLRTKKVSGPNAVLNGLFFDPAN